MPESRFCADCRAELSPGTAGDLCPNCIPRHETKTEAPPPPDADQARFHGRFTPPAPAELAKHFAHLELIDLLGQGGMGAVYKARQPSLDRFVALKLLPTEAASDTAFAERFAREARALAKLSHPNIVAIHDFGRAGEFYYFVMEFVDGTNLRQLLRQGPVSSGQALKIISRVCDGLQYAHEEGIVHRDIKPENLLLDRRGRVKIADFGLAKLLGQHTKDYTLTGPWQVMGTFHYMAPEQLDNPKAVDHRADIFALGVVLYELLTGQRPMGRFAPPSQRVAVDPRVDQIVFRALEAEPARRYASAAELGKALAAIVDERPAMLPTTPLDAPSTEADSATHVEGRPAAAEQLKPAAPRVPKSFPYRAILLFSLGWIFTGAMWNFRLPGLMAAWAVLCVLGYLVVHWRLKYMPDVREHLRGRTVLQRVSAHFGFLFGVSFGFVLLVSAHYQWWDMNPLSFRSPPRIELPPSEEDHPLVREWHQLRDPAPPVKFRDRLRAPDLGPAIPFLPTGPYSSSTIAWVIFLTYTLGGGAMFLTSSGNLLYHKALGRGWANYWKPGLGLGACLLLGLLAAHGVQTGVQISIRLFTGWTSTLDKRQISCDANRNEVQELVWEWGRNHGYSSSDRSYWELSMVERVQVKEVGGLKIIESWKGSPFDRWRMTWRGPFRPTPRFIVELQSLEGTGTTRVNLTTGDFDPTSPIEVAWYDEMDSLEAALEPIRTPGKPVLKGHRPPGP